MFVPLVGDEGGVEGNGFAIGICDGDLLRTSRKNGSDDEKSAGCRDDEECGSR